MEDDQITIVKDNWYLMLQCGPSAFARLRELIGAEAKCNDIGAVRRIEIVQSVTSTARKRDRVALLGCALAAVIFGLAGSLAVDGFYRLITGRGLFIP